MPQPIVYEALNLMLKSGTGIATYARGLATAARALGYGTEALVAANSLVGSRSAELAEIDLYDALSQSRRSWRHTLWLGWTILYGSPGAKRATALRRSRPAVDPGIDRLAGFSAIHTVPSLFDIARYQFQRRHQPLDVVLDIAPSIFHATHATPIRVRGCPNVYTIHDIVPLRVPHVTMENKPYQLELVRHLCRTADHIVTVSEFSRRDIMELTGISGERITNTYQAVELPAEALARSDAEVADDLDQMGLGWQEYFLFLGALEPKKNIERMIDAYWASGSKRPLLIAGGLGWMYDDILARIADERFLRYVIQGREIAIKRQVRRLDYVPRNRLVSLLRGARAVLFPSIYEGFGLPVAEAMLAGAPVMTSSTTSLPEIAGDAALLVDPYDVDAMAAAIRRLDADADLRRELAGKARIRAREFEPARHAERIGAVYKKLA